MSSPTRPDPRWRAWLGVGMLIGLLSFVLWPKALAKLGVFDYGMWFLDSYAILAASDTLQAGGDPVQPMALDIQHRAHVYSDWWYGVGKLGLTRDDNFLLGGLWVVGFIVAAWICLRPKSAAETAWYLLMFISPPVLLAVNRANNDLVIFVLLVAAAQLLVRQTPLRIAGAISVLGLATGLKYYPAAAAAVFLLVRPRSRLIVTLVFAAIIIGAALAQVGSAMTRAGIHEMPATIYTFGAAVLMRDAGLSGAQAIIAGALLLAALVAGSIFWRGLRAMSVSKTPTSQAAFVLGAAVLAACFVAGVSFAYRCMFLLLIAPWIWEHRASRPDAKVALWLSLAVLWLDGLSCLAINLVIGPVEKALVPTIQLGWRLSTQPLVWILMVILIRWLLEVFLAAWRDHANRAGAGAQPT